MQLEQSPDTMGSDLEVLWRAGNTRLDLLNKYYSSSVTADAISCMIFRSPGSMSPGRGRKSYVYSPRSLQTLLSLCRVPGDRGDQQGFPSCRPSKASEHACGASSAPVPHGGSVLLEPSAIRGHLGPQELLWKRDRPGFGFRLRVSGLLQVPAYSSLRGPQSPQL